MDGSSGAGRRTGPAIWLRWVVATAVGTVVAFAVFLVVFSVIGEPGDLLFPVLMVGIGAIVGAFQQRSLRRTLGSAAGWALATGVGIGAAMALGVAIGEREGLAGTTLVGTVDGAAAGAIIGTLQWRVLQGRLTGARWWVPASIGGWAIAGALANAVGYFVDGLDIVALFVGAAAATGVALVALVRSTPAAERSLSPQRAGRAGEPVE